jgi:hypothetical protein
MRLPQLDAVSPALATAAGLLLLAGAIALLRLSWLGKRPGNLPALIGGWLLIAAAFAALTHAFGAEVGTTYALLAMSVIAYAAIALGIENRSHKPAKVREIALEPEERPSNWSRGLAKSLLSIPLAGIAAIGAGVAFAVAMPIATHDRIVIGGLLVPILWGAGMAWTLSDAKLLRATLVLGSVSALGYGIAFVPKLLH